MRAPGALILAAGRGTRLGGGVPKPARMLAGKPMLNHIVDHCMKAGCDPVVAVIPPAERGGTKLRDAVRKGVVCVEQDEPLGTGHAASVAREALRDVEESLFVTVGDAPAFDAAMITTLLDWHRQGAPAITMATGHFDDPPAYGRVLRDEAGEVLRVVEERDASEEERQLRELMSSQYVFSPATFWRLLDRIQPSELTGEIYLTDVVGQATDAGERVLGVIFPESWKLLGLNTDEEWRAMEQRLAGAPLARGRGRG